MIKLTRYYQSKKIETGNIRALRDILISTFKWAFKSASYNLYYPSQRYTINEIKQADSIVEEYGDPCNVCVTFISQGGRIITLDTRENNQISITVDNKSDPPSKLLGPVERSLSLVAIGDVPIDHKVRSAFIAHCFNNEGTKYANEVARSLTLLGIHCQSGREFSPRSVSHKVNERLAKHDIFIAIASPQADSTWITQEIATAAALKKSVFILKQDDIELKNGILGDHEFIPFPKDQISKCFIPILEGLNEIQGLTANEFQ